MTSTMGAWIPVPAPLEGLIARLGRLSKAPAFAAQRQMALSRALQSYLATANEAPLAPLDQEVHLAELYVYADYYPEDGQLTLIEQLRDVITEHIPEEERQWLDPFKHSYMDLIEILPSSGEKSLLLCGSQGNGRRYRVRLDEPKSEFRVGQVLLARMSRLPGDTETEEAVIAGSALVLSAEDAKTIYEATGEYRREMEIAGGSFELGDWPEFAKRFGHILLWNVARMRVAALVDAVVSIRYVSSRMGSHFSMPLPCMNIMNSRTWPTASQRSMDCLKGPFQAPIERRRQRFVEQNLDPAGSERWQRHRCGRTAHPHAEPIDT